MKTREEQKTTLLVVDDEPLVLDLLTRTLRPRGFRVLCAGDGQQAIRLFNDEIVDLALVDYSLPDICGGDLFNQFRAARPELPVIILTGYPNLETAVALMKNGIRDYISKPFSLEQVLARINSILTPPRREELRAAETTGAGRSLPEKNPYVFGNSEIMRALEAQIRSLSRYPQTTVLISGPTGTGKTAVARRIHELTCGDGAPYVEIDCSTIPQELCESELFGHEKGSFTGAHCAKQGLFEAAGRGTAFLDEIGELDTRLQVKFLRVLEARQFKRVGGHSLRPMAARVIAATNRSLPDLVRAGRFREDLYFRLNVIELWMPPLRERGGDVMMLARHFLEHFATLHDKRITGFTAAALDLLRTAEFPGDIRELRNLIERAVINATSAEIEASLLLPHGHERYQPSAPLAAEPPAGGEAGAVAKSGAKMTLAEMEYSTLHEALKATQGNKSKAAELVGLSRTAFLRRLRKHHLASGV